MLAERSPIFLLGSLLLYCLVVVPACTEDHSAWRLPASCNGDCQVARDAATFADAVANATDAWSECICVENATITAAVTITKPLTLVGRGPASHIIAPSGQKGLVLRADDITLRDIEISSDTVALDIAQSQRVTLDGIRLTALPPADGAMSFALSLRDASVELTDAALTGDPGTATAVGTISGGAVKFSAVMATGFGTQGMTVSDDSSFSWNGGGMSDIRTENAALFVENATVTLRDVAIERISTPTTGNILYGGRGIIAWNGAALDIADSTVRDCSSIGILLDGTTHATIAGATVAGNALTGIWLQNGPTGTDQLTLTGSTITGNRAAGIALFRSCGVSISDTRIEKTTSAQWQDALVGDGMTAYGSVLADTTCAMTFTRVTFADNFRAGLIADGMEGTNALTALSFSGVQVVRSTSDAPGKYGIILQNGTAPAGLQAGVTANPFASADAALDTPLPLITAEQAITGTKYFRYMRSP